MLILLFFVIFLEQHWWFLVQRWFLVHNLSNTVFEIFSAQESALLKDLLTCIGTYYYGIWIYEMLIRYSTIKFCNVNSLKWYQIVKYLINIWSASDGQRIRINSECINELGLPILYFYRLNLKKLETWPDNMHITKSGSSQSWNR